MIWKIVKEGWRPGIGWVLVLGLLHEFVLRHWFVIGGSDVVQLAALIGTVLGMSGLRGWEKAKDLS